MSEDEEIDTNDATEDPDTRWAGLSTAMAILIGLTYVVLPVGAAIGVFNLGAITQPWYLMLSLGFLTVLAYVFGQGKLKAAKEALGK